MNNDLDTLRYLAVLMMINDLNLKSFGCMTDSYKLFFRTNINPFFI